MLIYRVRCLENGKVYIGLTRQRYLSDRWSQHVRSAALGLSGALYAAMRKYGTDRFRCEPFACSLRAELLGQLEQDCIAQENSFAPNGYNLSFGGESAVIGRVMSAEGRARLSAARMSDSARERNSQAQRRRTLSPDWAAHQAAMVAAARLATEKQSASAKRRSSTVAGREHLLSAAKLGAQRNREISSKPVMVGSDVYASVKDAAEAFGIERNAIRWRIKSGRFPDWSYA